MAVIAAISPLAIRRGACIVRERQSPTLHRHARSRVSACTTFCSIRRMARPARNAVAAEQADHFARTHRQVDACTMWLAPVNL
jgi:hypothetical protein